MNGKRLTALILALVLALSLAACTKKPVPSEPDAQNGTQTKEITLTDLIGREITVTPGNYERVVCIGAGALRMYTYVGDVALLAGVEDIDNLSAKERPKMFDAVARPYMLAFSDVFESLPSCGVGGPNAQTAEAEKILSCNPDIVISEYEDVDKENALQEQLGVPVVTLRTGPDGVFGAEFRDSMTLLGTIFGREARATELLNYVEKETEEIRTRTKDVPDAEKPTVYICGLGNWGTTNHLMTAQNYKPFEIANVKNAVTDLGKNGIQSIEAEKFVAVGKDVDIVFIDAAAVKNIRPLYAEDKTLLDPLKAWKEGEAYLEMAYNAYYTNYEIALANTWFIAKTVYPDRFADIAIDAKLNEITNAFLGKNLTDEVYAMGQSFGGYQKIDTGSFFN